LVQLQVDLPLLLTPLKMTAHCHGSLKYLFNEICIPVRFLVIHVVSNYYELPTHFEDSEQVLYLGL